MKLSERIRRFWLPGRPVDHALSEEERQANHPDERVYDELARLSDHRAGDSFDPDRKDPR
jgi:hypothetical protein